MIKWIQWWTDVLEKGLPREIIRKLKIQSSHPHVLLFSVKDDNFSQSHFEEEE